MKTIYESLNFVIDDNTYVNGFHEYKEDIPSLPQRLNRSLKVINPSALFILNDKPIILFFDKNTDKKEVFRQSWNFSEAPIIIIENESDFDIYNGFDYILENGNFLLSQITKENELNYISIISGQYFNDSQKNFDKKEKKVDKKLLENIKEAREELLSFNLKNHLNIANALLGRIIFIRYLIDRKVSLRFEGKHQALTNDELKEILSSKERTYNLFKYLKSKDGFNGDWFPIEEEEHLLVQLEHLSILQTLISGTEIKTGQQSLFDIYNFSIIPIEFISNVYESFIGEENQKKSGAYYTPTFLVDYILKYTVDEYFKNNPQEYNCKVLDPACGSGIFLVETLRKIIKQYENVTKKSITSKQIVKLVKDNIYGIDYNVNALQISVFSLYLTMLDYQEPCDIEKFTFPYLLKSNKNKNANFFENDFFDTKAEYNQILKKKEINFIIGNPPYKRGGGNSEYISNYISNREAIEKNSVGYSNKEIAQAFLIRASDVSKKALISFIVNSKIFYNSSSQNFRKYLLSTYNIEHILELSSVRKEVFETAKTPVLIIFYKYGNQESNSINYMSLKPNPMFKKIKMLSIAKTDYKKVLQSKLYENDFLWKVLVYGSYLDFNLMKKLSTNFNSISDVINNKDNYIVKQGFKLKDGNKRVNTSSLIGKPYINLMNKGTFIPFHVKNKLDTFSYREVGYIYKEDEAIYQKLYEGNSLLVKDSIEVSTLKQVSAVSYGEAIFTDSLTAIQPLDNNLKIINGLLYSSFFAYYILQRGSYTGVEREKANDDEKFGFPFIKNQKVLSIVNKFEKTQDDYYSKNLEIFTYQSRLKQVMLELDTAVLEAFNLTNEEYALVNYTNNIVIPWILGKKEKKYDIAFKSLEYKDEIIEKYVNIFINHYSKIYQQMDKYFQANILWDEYAIGIYFKVLGEEPQNQITWKKEKNIQNFLKLSGGKTLENLFIQKDIKGFEADGFYVVKPNEYKNWHEAIGYLDFYEFDKAILGAGRRGENV